MKWRDYKLDNPNSLPPHVPGEALILIYADGTEFRYDDVVAVNIMPDGRHLEVTHFSGWQQYASHVENNFVAVRIGFRGETEAPDTEDVPTLTGNGFRQPNQPDQLAEIGQRLEVIEKALRILIHDKAENFIPQVGRPLIDGRGCLIPRED